MEAFHQVKVSGWNFSETFMKLSSYKLAFQRKFHDILEILV